MEKVVNIIKTDEQQRDVHFWRTQSPERRLATLEAIRQEYIAWKYGTQPGLHRVYHIVKHT
jgi:hypothetical protein